MKNPGGAGLQPPKPIFLSPPFPALVSSLGLGGGRAETSLWDHEWWQMSGRRLFCLCQERGLLEVCRCASSASVPWGSSHPEIQPCFHHVCGISVLLRLVRQQRLFLAPVPSRRKENQQLGFVSSSWRGGSKQRPQPWASLGPWESRTGGGA